MSLHRVSKRSVFVVCGRLCQCVMLFVGVCVSVLCCVLVSVSVCFVLCLNAMIVSVRNFSLWSTQGRTFLRHRKCGGMKWRIFHFRNAAMPQVHLTCWLCIFLRMSSRFRLTVLPTPPPFEKQKLRFFCGLSCCCESRTRSNACEPACTESFAAFFEFGSNQWLIHRQHRFRAVVVTEVIRQTSARLCILGFFSLKHGGHFLLRHFGHLSHGCIKTRHNSVH